MNFVASASLRSSRRSSLPICTDRFALTGLRFFALRFFALRFFGLRDFELPEFAPLSAEFSLTIQSNELIRCPIHCCGSALRNPTEVCDSSGIPHKWVRPPHFIIKSGPTESLPDLAMMTKSYFANFNLISRVDASRFEAHCLAK